MKRALFIGLFSLALLAYAWEPPVKIDGGTSDIFAEITIVRFDYSGAANILYDINQGLRLARYDGQRVELIGKINTGTKKTYCASMVIAKDNKMHIAWAEATSRLAEQYYIMYRTREGGVWSDVMQIAKINVPGIPQSKHGPPKIEFIRIGVDSEENLFIAYYDATRARCKFISKYGDVVTQEDWPSREAVRMKYPDIAVTDDLIHVVWQHGIIGSANYTSMWARRENKINGKWLPNIDLKQGKHYVHSSHNPIVTLDNTDNPHFLYMDDGRDGPGREIIYNYAIGSNLVLKDRLFLTPNRGYYSNNNIAMFDKDNGFVTGHKVVKLVHYVFKEKGDWTGMKTLETSKGSDSECGDISKDGKVAASSYTTNWNTVWLSTSSKIVVNDPPKAVIAVDSEEAFWRDELSFDASGSTDSDGTIVKYEWNFGDGEKAEGSQVKHAFVNKYGNIKVKLIVTDDKGAMTTATKVMRIKALYTAEDITFTKKKMRTLLYDRMGYLVYWSPNLNNQEAGYNIVGYKIFRRAVGETGEYTEVGQTDITKNGFTDMSIDQAADAEYDYSVCPLDDQGHYSPVNHY